MNKRTDNPGQEDAMPDKDFAFIHDVLNWFRTMAPTLYASAVSVAIATLRIIYDDRRNGVKIRPKSQIALEATLCGGLTVVAVSLGEIVGVPTTAAAGVGGMVGFLGVDRIRLLAEKFLNTKAGNGSLD